MFILGLHYFGQNVGLKLGRSINVTVAASADPNIVTCFCSSPPPPPPPPDNLLSNKNEGEGEGKGGWLPTLHYFLREVLFRIQIIKRIIIPG